VHRVCACVFVAEDFSSSRSLKPPQTPLQHPLPPLLHSLIKPIEHIHRHRPVHTRVGNANTMFEERGDRDRRVYIISESTSIGQKKKRTIDSRHILPPPINITLNHHPRNRPLTRLQLRTYSAEDVGLVEVVLLGVAVY